MMEDKNIMVLIDVINALEIVDCAIVVDDFNKVGG